MASPITKTMTIEEFLSLPEDGMDRELIHGELRERPMTVRNRRHAQIEARLAQALGNWIDGQPDPQGCVFSGEVGGVLQRDPYTVVGIDVAFVSAAIMDQSTATATTLIDGHPILAAEILSPSDTLESISEKIDLYLSAGTPLVWVIDPFHETVSVYRSDALPEMFNSGDRLESSEHLPGFRVAVAKLFA